MVRDTCVMEWMTSLERMVVMAWLPESVSGRLVGGGRLATKVTVLCPNTNKTNRLHKSTTYKSPSLRTRLFPST